jgi:hypothetical protein
MRSSELDRAMGATPPGFTARVALTLEGLKEEPIVLKKPIRRTLIIAFILLLAVGAAIALVVTQGQDWYYNNRFTAYQTYEPEKQEAIFTHLTTDIPQEQVDMGLVSVTVQDVSWAQAEHIATLSLSARPLHPENDELYSIWNLDQDGCWSETLDPDDPEIRTEHWLWTDKGYGLPESVMADPTKRLLLLDDGDTAIFIGRDGNMTLPLYCFDYFLGEDGTMICVMEFDLSALDEQAIRDAAAAQVYDPDAGIDEENWRQQYADSLNHQLCKAQEMNAAIAANTDAEGMLTLRYEYQVIPFANHTLVSDEAIQSETIFQIKVQ